MLQSVASGSTLCIYDGQVSGKGIRDAYCKWKQQNSNNIVCLYIHNYVICYLKNVVIDSLIPRLVSRPSACNNSTYDV